MKASWRQFFKKNDFGEGELRLSVIKISKVGGTALDCRIQLCKGEFVIPLPYPLILIVFIHGTPSFAVTCGGTSESFDLPIPPHPRPGSTTLPCRHQLPLLLCSHVCGSCLFSLLLLLSFRSRNSCLVGGTASWLALFFPAPFGPSSPPGLITLPRIQLLSPS